ncbi:anhydro-N-acetylmuramic acid kinase [Vibrio quintilis]|uniref:Anhydro-N-acetylmuramic acid kinase n=1 Tax=Vibrio quintilis TaxID=1117707 RepID=A0A1M7YRK3_9VIBR|nr:anhydro-N-acetylmuramic acid kinase [Vibrio quintilis]SHO55244.1 Anhydro-N-acetylmuramic acid kinase [Vibrio quintilis]
MQSEELYIGVMSGTSLDGIDVVLAGFENNQVQIYADYCHPIPPDIRQQILSICTGQFTSLKTIGTLDHQLGHLFSQAVNQLLSQTPYQAKDIRAIGCHGQTVFHHPDQDTPFTIQLGDANIIAVQTGIDTVADFRRKDMALGGQGAPLVPAFHQEVFQSQTHSTVVVLNIGGMANISVLRPEHPVLGYDTGPGNVLIDSWCQQHTGTAYDKDAALALSGQVNTELLKKLESDPYFSAPAPKSTGREYFNMEWLNRHLEEIQTPIKTEDIQRTLCQLTVDTISAQITGYVTGTKPCVYVCGGGVHNPLIMKELATKLTQWHITTTSEYGISSDSMEAIAFAWLAKQRIHHLPGNIPEVTGASKAVSLGIIYRAT